MVLDCDWSISVQLIPNRSAKICNNSAKICNNSAKFCNNSANSVIHLFDCLTQVSTEI